jgi:hypothetical protein
MPTTRDTEPEELVCEAARKSKDVNRSRDLLLVLSADRLKGMSMPNVVWLVDHPDIIVAFRLQDCTDDTISLFTVAASREKRSGWVSDALVRVLARDFVEQTAGLIHMLREERLPLPPSIVWQVIGPDARLIAKSMEFEQSFAESVGAEQVQQGHAIARSLALRQGGVLKDSAGLGYDVRSAVLQDLTGKACLLTDLCSPTVVSESRFSLHTSADSFALETQLRVGITAKKMALLFGGEVVVDAPVIVRLNPRGSPSTAVVVKVRLPGMHPVCFSWPAERPR